MGREEPTRTCTGCGEERPKEELVRVAMAPSGEFFPDLSGKAPGRGAYVCPRADCVEKAARGRLAAVLKAQAGEKPGPLAERLRAAMAAGLESRALSLLGLAQRQGAAVSGTSLVEGELKGAPRSWGFLLVAKDASVDVTDKAVRRAGVEGVPVGFAFTRERIGLAMGKSPRSAVLVREGSLARAVAQSVERAKAVSSGSTQEESGNG